MPTALGQVPLGLSQATPSSNQTSVTSSAPRPVGNLVFSPVKLDGRKIFRVTAVESGRANGKEVESPLRRRVGIIQKELYDIIKRGFDPETLEVTVGTLNRQTVILVSDPKQQELTTQPVVTVTSTDAQLYGLPVSKWAEELAEIIRTSLIRAQQERQPGYLLKQGLVSGGIILGMMGISWVLGLLQKRQKAQWKTLEEQQPASLPESSTEQETATSEDEVSAVERAQTPGVKEQQIVWQLGINFNNLMRLLLQIGQSVIWLGGILWIMGLFPWTRGLQRWFFQEPVHLLGVVLATKLALKLADFLIDRSLAIVTERQSPTATVSQRQVLRFSTFSGVIKGLVTFVIVGIGVILALYALGIPIGPVLGGAGILAFGISLASQNLVKDVINGTLILLEDQYAVGDFIQVAGVSGKVENMNLRITQLRNIQGTLITIPHASVDIVQNQSKDWSRVNFTVEVGYETDVVQAMQLIKQVAEQMSEDPKWKAQILDPIDALGVTQIAYTGIQCLIRIKTQPGEQWAVEREFCRRLKLAFDEHGISIGVPQWKFIQKELSS
ncbi:MAG: mechanosensitive ion channel family protein [Xenococcaceae cyanobacterium]